MNTKKQPNKFIVGSRASPLAQRQAEIAGHLLQKQGITQDLAYESFTTSGDLLSNKPLRDFGGKGLFCKELDVALLERRIDLAVHSAKDMGTELHPDLAIVAVLPRGPAGDVLVSKRGWTLEDLPLGAHLGTASLRRQVLLSYYRPDLRISLLRGNVNTRLKKIEEGHYDATILAQAGLQRLGFSSIGVKLDERKFVPAVGQGCIALMIRKDHPLFPEIEQLSHQETALCLGAERAFLRCLDGNCHTPIGGHAILKDHLIFFRGMLGDPESGRVVFVEGEGLDPEQLGQQLAFEAREKMGR